MRHHDDRPGSPGAELRRLGGRLRGAVGGIGGVGARGRPRPAPRVLILPDVAIGTQILLGRSRASDVRFLEPTVSRRHAALQRVDGGWLVVDRASTHGTWVDGRRVGTAILADGDELRLGEARLTVRL
jgi:pSer/pThr/pTyr-binding forkhead associated (FHA) protein